MFYYHRPLTLSDPGFFYSHEDLKCHISHFCFTQMIMLESKRARPYLSIFAFGELSKISSEQKFFEISKIHKGKMGTRDFQNTAKKCIPHVIRKFWQLKGIVSAQTIFSYMIEWGPKLTKNMYLGPIKSDLSLNFGFLLKFFVIVVCEKWLHRSKTRL